MRPSGSGRRLPRASTNTSGETLLLKAFSAAASRRDVENKTLIASSLAELYYYDMNDEKSAAMWLRKLEDALKHHFDRGEQQILRELRNALKGYTR